MLEFTPLAGPFRPAIGKGKQRQNETDEQPKAVSYLVDIDGCRILLDCGSPEDFTFASSPQESDGFVPNVDHPDLVGSLPDILERIAPQIDVVLLTHAEISHLGFYAYARAHYGLQCTVYTTLPVQAMGRLAMQEAIRAWNVETETHDTTRKRYLPTEAEVEDAFDAIRTLRYLQPTPLEGKSAGLVLTAYNAGHSLGGTVWKVRSPSVGTVVMALDWNHSRERHLDRTALLPSHTPFQEARKVDSVGRADVLITDIERGLLVNSGRKDRDASLLDRIHQTLSGGHSVLIPVDSAARLLELLVLLDQHWSYAYQHQRFPLCLVSRTGQEFLDRARTFIEWMSREWAAQMLSDDGPKGRKRAKNNNAIKSPLDFPFLRLFTSLDAFRNEVATSQPKVVLATPASLTHGHARMLLSDFLTDPDALLLLTTRGEPGSAMRTLWDRWNARQADKDAWRRGKVGTAAAIGGHLSYEIRRRARLTGEELRAYLEREQQAKAQEAQKAQSQASQRARPQLEADEAEDDGSSSESSDDDEPTMDRDAHRLLMSTRAIAPERLTAAEGRQELSFDIYLRGLASRTQTFMSANQGQEYGAGIQYRMFPFFERKRKVDAYGEAIDTSKWLSRRQKLEAEQEDQLDPSRHLAKEDQKRVAQPEPPSKLVVEALSVTVRCHVMYVDMQGLNDGRALKMLLPQLQPRRLIMVNGDAATNADLCATLSAVRGFDCDMYTPGTGTTVKIGELTHSYTVKLSDALFQPSHWSTIEDYNVMPLRALPEWTSDSDVPTLISEETTQDQDTSAPTTLYIGDLKLTALKASLARKHRIRADFAGEGVLVCDGAPSTGRRTSDVNRSVTVKKQGTGQVVIEGNLSAGLRRIRESVYDLCAQVHQ